MVSTEGEVSYRLLEETINKWRTLLREENIKQGDCVAIIGGLSVATSALTVALISHCCIVVPLTGTNAKTHAQNMAVANISAVFVFDELGGWQLQKRPAVKAHRLVKQLGSSGKAGLILFSSGTTGMPKASLLDFEKLLDKYRHGNRGVRTLVFLLLDHIGGINTMFAVLTQGGTLVAPEARDPDSICQLIERYQIELLPTTPTFLRMLLISNAYNRYDLSSLVTITYGTEPMPEATLQALTEVMPQVKFKQTYGLSELGIMSTRSASSSSTMIKIGGDGFEYKIINDILWIKSRSAMLGYLNHENPFDESGWFKTGDMVEVHGDYLKILGRKSELINVGGEKVHPGEVENVLQRCENISEATVYGKNSPVTGQIVAANISLVWEEPETEVIQRVRKICAEFLESYKVPRHITIITTPHHSERFKKKGRI